MAMANDREPGVAVMDCGDTSLVAARRARDVRLVEVAGVVTAYPEPHRTPVLPSGWAPLTDEEQSAVLVLCEAHESAVRLRLPSLWDSGR